MVTEKSLVVKANTLVEASYRLSLWEQRVILFMASMIRPGDSDFQTYTVKISELKKIAGLERDGSGYKRIEDVTKKLLSKVLSIKEKGADILLQVSWLSSARYFYGEGYVQLRFDPDLKPYLLQLKKCFTRYRLKNVMYLKSSYSIRLYELLKQCESVGERTFSLENLRAILGIEPGEYKLYSNFKNRVIKPSQKEINSEKTDLRFDFVEKKKGRKVAEIIFRIRSDKVAKEEKESAPFVPDEQKTISGLEAELISMKLSKKQAQAMVKKYPEDRIRRNIDMTLKKAEKGEVINIPAFLTEAVREDYAKDYTPVDEEHQELISEAKKCWQKTSGSCQAAWDNYRDNRGHACHWCKKFVAKRNSPAGADLRQQDVGEPQPSDNPESLFAIVPVKITNPLRTLITQYHKSEGFDYVRRNIEHTNQNIKDKRKYRAFLEKTLIENQAAGVENPGAENKQEENDNRFEQLKSAFADLSSDQQESVKSAFFDYLKAKGSASVLIKTYRKKGIDSVIIQPVWEEYLEKTLDI